MKKNAIISLLTTHYACIAIGYSVTFAEKNMKKYTLKTMTKKLSQDELEGK